MIVHRSFSAIRRIQRSAKQAIVNAGFVPSEHGIIDESTTNNPSYVSSVSPIEESIERKY